MAKKVEPKAGERRNEPEGAPSGQVDLAQVIGALKQVTEALTTVGNQLQQLVPAGGVAPGPAAAVEINTWDDPFSELAPTVNPPRAAVTAVALATNTNPRLRTAVVEPQLPVARYSPGTDGFRYWVASEAINRGINFWGALLPAGTTWSTSNPMRVILVDAIDDLNAQYRRIDGLHFYKSRVASAGIDIYSGESPDIVCHELGHAVLDALRPQLFNAGDAEASAFHEAFGDISAMLVALQFPSTRQSIITETSGRLNANSRLSRLAEQLGWAIRQTRPDLVDRDSLRNAANHFFYRRIDTVPPSAPANLLSSRPHSFSRVFTGAFLDVLARMFTATGVPNEANLLAVSRDLGQLVVDAVLAATVTTGYFSQVAAAMIQADLARFGGRNRPALTSAFLERGILSVDSAVAMADAPIPKAVGRQRGAVMVADNIVHSDAAMGSPTVYAYEGEVVDDGFRLGYGETPELPSRPISIGGLTIDVHAPVQKQRFEVASAMVGAEADSALGADTAMQLFVEGLIQRREIDLGTATRRLGEMGAKDSGRATHSLVAEGGKQVLKRNHFACGFCKQDGPGFACV
ncbi:hypothetical protein [Bradyrhizobium sp.]|jgi:hypothetical protein|uniref:hypothetical protein n=1 Tax=Bradyrhizobium sp. TaxID=376 RepID=UPI002E072883|nr:hypothetical protein [Bradyrhizobium sp.]